MTPEERAKWFADLREMVDFVEASGLEPGIAVMLQVQCDSRDGLIRAARAMGRTQKSAFGNYFFVERYFGHHHLYAATPREQVCTRKVLEVKRVPATVIPAHNEEVVEWECPDSILKLEPQHATV